MKKLYAFIVLVIAAFPGTDGLSQDIPLFSQKLTNSFIYNPAVAGHNLGSLTYSFRQNYGGIANAPKNNFLSVHTPLAGHKIGIGLNYYQEDVNFIKNGYASAAFAYHLRLNRFNSLSFGVSGEYNFMRINGTTNSDPADPDYIKLANGELNDMDFSFGMLYQSKYVKAGLSANRLSTAWIKKENDYILSSFYTGFIQGTIPLRHGEDLLEPYVTYRKFSETNNTYDAGLYYTYNSRVMLGAAFRKGSIGSLTAGFYLTPKLLLGYTREMFLSDVQSQVGSSHEFTLRLNFNEYDFKSSFSDSYKSSLAYRRKSMSSNRGNKSPAQLHRNQKKLASFSPNKRYQSVKKLSVTPSSQRVKVKSRYKPPVKRRRRK